MTLWQRIKIAFYLITQKQKHYVYIADRDYRGRYARRKKAITRITKPSGKAAGIYVNSL